MKIIYSLILVSLVWVSCDNGTSDLSINNQRIQNELQKRKQEYLASVLENCNVEMFQKATDYVDSLIAAELAYQLSDSIVFPPKPEYPGWPGPILLNDTLKAQPILPEK